MQNPLRMMIDASLRIRERAERMAKMILNFHYNTGSKICGYHVLPEYRDKWPWEAWAGGVSVRGYGITRKDAEAEAGRVCEELCEKQEMDTWTVTDF